MPSIWKMAVAVALVASAACARDGVNETADAGNAAINMAAEAPGQSPAPSTQATNAAGGKQAAGVETAGSILAWSRPAAGSTVSAPVNELVFHFTPPARLGELTVTGPDGAMPMMVTAVGEVEHYSLPLSGLGPGRYAVDWRASARGVDYRGSFRFEAR